MQFHDVVQALTNHGFKGEVKVKVVTDFPEQRFCEGVKLFTKDDMRQLTVESGRPFKQFWLVTFKEIKDINEVESLLGKTLVISEEDREQLPEGHYYYHQIIGLSVIDNEIDELIDKVIDVEAPGVNDIWQVTPKVGKPFRFPYAPSFIKSANLDKEEARIELMEGLRDEDQCIDAFPRYTYSVTGFYAWSYS